MAADLPPATYETSDRLERAMEVISLASVGEYATAIEHCGALREDEFGMLEEGLRIFLRELMTTAAEREQAMTALQRANHEIEGKLALIASQSETIRELSSPILDVWDGVVAVPLVGALDHAGALALTEKLLHRVVATRADWALLDLTGVDVIDATTADHLVQLARALRLVGGNCIVTGVSPAAAETFASLAGGLGGVRCLANLREGLRACMTTTPGRHR
jgi:rsbT co-antagonist protein RsbR